MTAYAVIQDLRECAIKRGLRLDHLHFNHRTDGGDGAGVPASQVLHAREGANPDEGRLGRGLETMMWLEGYEEERSR